MRSIKGVKPEVDKFTKEQVELMEKHYHLVNEYIEKRGWVNTDLDEAVLDGFLEAVMTYDESKSSFKTHFNLRVRWRLMKNYTKKYRRSEIAEITYIGEQEDYIKDSLNSDVEEEIDLLSLLPSELSEKERDIVLKRYNGYTMREISDEYGVSTQAIYYILKNLRGRLDREDFIL